MSDDKFVIDCGDVVLHKPTGEQWVVAYVHGDRIAWCGWPEGEALLSDCELVKAATDEERLKLLHQIAETSGDGPRQRDARWRLGKRGEDALKVEVTGRS